jgi:hypothetical protein
MAQHHHHHRDSERFHAVRFYEDDASLCRIATGFVGDGLASGDPAVVIATPPHRAGIVDGLGALSFDVERLKQRGDLRLLDVEETLSTFMKDGMPDPVAFQRSMGGVLDEVARGRSQLTVRAYGEMVDWLWKNGDVTAALRLEVLWNELADSRVFSLLCGYSMGNFYKHGAYEDICRQHTHVVSAEGLPTAIVVG